MTGNAAAAADFLESWAASQTTPARVMQIDSLIQALHGRGALAPAFTEGTTESIRQLLDERATCSQA